MVIAALLLVTCNNLHAKEFLTPDTAEATTFRGEIARGIRIEMRLYRDGSSLYGTYFYRVFARDIQVKGTIDDSGELALQETVKGKVTGRFEGKFVTKDRIEGMWYKSGSDKGRRFYLDGKGIPSAARGILSIPQQSTEDRKKALDEKVRSTTEAKAKESLTEETRPEASSNAKREPAPVVEETRVGQQERKASAEGLHGVAADEETHAEPGVMEKSWADRFSVDFRILTYGVDQKPANSSQNPSNNFLQMAQYVTVLELRPDMRLNLEPLELSAKPRMRLDYSFWREGVRKGESRGDDDWFVNEWTARLKARENLFLSYGRENLQWGPSFLFSPSNPFFQDNGRRNPYLEVPGMDFARLVWIPGSSWTASFIANTNEGLNKTSGPGLFLASSLPPPFEKTYALKIDYTGRQNYASAILSHREGFNDSFGLFGGWTASDALLLYAEGAVTQGSEALYPRSNNSPVYASMQQSYLNSTAMSPVVLIGGSYTFEAKGTLSMEYAYYSPGYSEAQAESYYALRRKAGQAFNFGGPLSGSGPSTLGQTAGTGLRLLRRNYALFQYVQNNIKNVIDLTMRWTQNLDDGSGQFTAIVAFSLGKHLEFFTVGTLMAGDKNTEFGSILDYQCMMGLRYTH